MPCGQSAILPCSPGHPPVSSPSLTDCLRPPSRSAQSHHRTGTGTWRAEEWGGVGQLLFAGWVCFWVDQRRGQGAR